MLVCERVVEVWNSSPNIVNFSLLRNILMSVSVCLSVCLSVRSYNSKHTMLCTFICTLPLAVVRFSSDGVAIRYALPVLRMTSRFT